jgi:sugar phosphate isomerase/epimerase
MFHGNAGFLLTRRQFTSASLGAIVTAAALPASSLAAPASSDKNGKRYCAFIKYLRELKYEELAERIAELGFGGVEVTVRQNDGYIKPSEVKSELPKFKKILEKHGLDITIVTTDILAADQEHAENTLKTATELGVPRYRLGFYRYELDQPILDQIAGIRLRMEKLAALNRKIGILGMYQNHSGPTMFGATMWDLYYILRDLSPEELSCVYDLRHATVEAGESWPLLYKVMKPHIAAYSVKDFQWKERQTKNVPLGDGMVDPQFYKTLAQSGYEGPISLHVEYLNESAGANAQLAAIKRDYATLRDWMGRSGQ